MTPALVHLLKNIAVGEALFVGFAVLFALLFALIIMAAKALDDRLAQRQDEHDTVVQRLPARKRRAF